MHAFIHLCIYSFIHSTNMYWGCSLCRPYLYWWTKYDSYFSKGKVQAPISLILGLHWCVQAHMWLPLWSHLLPHFSHHDELDCIFSNCEIHPSYFKLPLVKHMFRAMRKVTNSLTEERDIGNWNQRDDRCKIFLQRICIIFKENYWPM